MFRQGKANFSQGSLSHDLFRVIEDHGIVPEQVYPGLECTEVKHGHVEME